MSHKAIKPLSTVQHCMHSLFLPVVLLLLHDKSSQDCQHNANHKHSHASLSVIGPSHNIDQLVLLGKL